MNYQDNATRKTGAISYLLYTSFGMSSNNTVQRAKFINAKPVYFPPMEYKWSNDDYGNGSYKTSVFHDKDGSVGGVPNSFIVINERNRHRRRLRDQAHLERCGVQGRCRAHDCWRRRRPAVVVVAVVAQAPVPAVRGGAAGRWRSCRWQRVARWCSLAPEAVVGSEAPLHLRSRQSFSAATARISPSPEQPTYERVPSSR